MIRSSKHSIKFSNKNKYQQLVHFINEYKLTLNKFINMQWNEQDHKNNFLSKDKYSKIKSKLNCRMRQCASKQACSMVKSVLSKHHKRLYKLKELQKEGKNTKYLQRKIDKTILSKPKFDNINVELDPRFVEIRSANKHFDLFIKLNLGNKNLIKIPIKHTKVSKKWLSQGKLLNSIRLNDKSITLYFEINNKKSIGNKIIGMDQGLITTISCSDGQVTTKNKDGYDLSKIQTILCRRKNGSKGFRRAQEHRKNYINWSINQLNFIDVKEIRLEKIKNIRKGKRVSRILSHWTYTLIRDKLKMLCEQEGFKFTEQDNKFMSQRCSSCGWTHQSNRKGKTFRCTSIICNYVTDSDLNAASNHEMRLIELPLSIWQQHLNRTTGFYWLSDKVVVDQECIVPDVKKE